MAEGKVPLTRSAVWTLNKVALENELRERNVPFPVDANREQLRKLLRHLLGHEQRTNNAGDNNGQNNLSNLDDNDGNKDTISHHSSYVSDGRSELNNDRNGQNDASSNEHIVNGEQNDLLALENPGHGNKQPRSREWRREFRNELSRPSSVGSHATEAIPPTKTQCGRTKRNPKR